MSEKKNQNNSSNLMIWAIAIAAVLVLFNQWQIMQVSSLLSGTSHTSKISASLVGNVDLKDVDVSNIQNTAQAIATVFPLKDVKTADDAIKLLIPTGTTSYGQELGLTYDDPVKSLNTLARYYNTISKEIKTNNPTLWQRYLNLATKPVGISCEYCCGVGPVGITKDGKLSCGCSHNPAIHALTLYLMKNTDWNDAQVLQEALRWKSLWFPKNMIGLAVQIAGGDSSVLNNVPGMVGGC